MQATFMIPRPPSVNACFATDFRTRRRFATKAYSEWKLEVLALILPQVKHKFDCKIAVKYRLGREPDKRRRDLGNYEKPTTDVLVEAGVIQDDCLIQEQLLQWTDDVPRGMVEVTVTMWGE